MTDYDSMSVGDLILELVNEVVGMGATTRMKSAHFPTPESALRKAVIREASVGTITVELHEGYMGGPKMAYSGSNLDGIPAGQYDLIPKETP